MKTLKARSETLQADFRWTIHHLHLRETVAGQLMLVLRLPTTTRSSLSAGSL